MDRVRTVIHTMDMDMDNMVIQAMATDIRTMLTAMIHTVTRTMVTPARLVVQTERSTITGGDPSNQNCNTTTNLFLNHDHQSLTSHTLCRCRTGNRYRV